ncbi:hypothetical protein Barb6_03399 [Bacteroidales bacterium Barb6]|nr:hypothetical protein Barb6_03399 [Bacteroidales bacterium Barb6]
MRVLGVEKHGGANAVPACGALQNVLVDAAFASAPEGLVVRQLGKGHGDVSQVGIHLHHGTSGGETEHFSLRPAQAGEGKGGLFDTPGYAHVAVVVGHNQPRRGDILLVPPRLYVGESDKVLTLKGDDGFPLLHLLRQIIVGTLGNARPAYFRSRFNRFQNCIHIHFV